MTKAVGLVITGKREMSLQGDTSVHRTANAENQWAHNVTRGIHKNEQGNSMNPNNA